MGQRRRVLRDRVVDERRRRERLASLQAQHGSTHGYDVTDPTKVSADLGGEPAFRGLCEAAHEAGLGVLLDIVPNHMAIGPENPF